MQRRLLLPATRAAPLQPRMLLVRCCSPCALPSFISRYVEFSLQYIFGIGHTTAKAILASTGVENKRTKVSGGAAGWLVVYSVESG